MAPDAILGLNVVALVSGGKDSFFSALHCLENGHRLVALANLHPPLPPPASAPGAEGSDLNSFMYQTVGHEVIPLYAEATGLPLYRRAIAGAARQSARHYSAAALPRVSHLDDKHEDETESMVPLLQAVLRQHPHVNAVSAGAILSTYQRTRVESVALRLGLTPLAYLWNYPALPPPPGASKDEAQLLFDMAAAGLEARIIKVASGGLDESFLWESVASARGITRLKKAMSRFGSMDTGAVVGEGGEFETLVVNGPKALFKKRVAVAEDAKTTVNEGGGTAWLSVGTATLEQKDEGEEEQGQVRKPSLVDARFEAVLGALQTSRQEGAQEENNFEEKVPTELLLGGGRRADHPLTLPRGSNIETWAFTGSQASAVTAIQETSVLIRHIQERLSQRGLAPSSILSSVIVLRSMTDFPAVNAVYGSLFPDPNPPSRVTISCGDLLPPASGNIAIYLTLPSSSSSPSRLEQNTNRRDGLHVQSRSYWAPANIGPYSQAIAFPASLLSSDSFSSSRASRIVHVAGQIPLVPASMEFLPRKQEDAAGGSGSRRLEMMQLVLSLQHLWRIGAEMGVQWWTSAAVYFPSSEDPLSSSARDKAWLAWRAWKAAHEWKVQEEDDDDDDKNSGPDLWDRKFNAQYMSYATDEGKAGGASYLPDYSLFTDDEEEAAGVDGRRRRRRLHLPYFLAVEVDELPRSAEAEWHAHAGLSGMTTGSGSADSLSVSRSWWTGGGSSSSVKSASPLVPCEVHHCILTSTLDPHPDDDDNDVGTDEKVVAACLHSVVAVQSALSQDDDTATTVTTTTPPQMTLQEVLAQANRALCASLDTAAVTPPHEQGSPTKPYLVYVDTEAFGAEDIARVMGDDSTGGGLAVVPCRNLYGCGGGRLTRLGVVVLYRHFLS